MTDYYAVINAKKCSSNVKDCISDSIHIKISYNRILLKNFQGNTQIFLLLKDL